MAAPRQFTWLLLLVRCASLHRTLVLLALLASPRAAWAQLSPEEVQAVAEQIESESSVEYVCQDGTRGSYDAKQGPWKLTDHCALSVRWLPRFSIDASASVIPKQLLIVSVTDHQAYFIKKLPSSELINELWIPAGEWFDEKRYRFGVRYEIWIEYDLIVDSAAGAGGVTLVAHTEVIDRKVRLSVFIPQKDRFTWQVTGKIFTAWEIGNERDRSFIAPGISTGFGYRYGEHADDRDVIGLRVMTALGPNLVSKPRVTIDGDDVVPEKSRRKVQWLVGAELVLGRYLATGPAWVVMGSETSAMPMLMVTYGELYPALSID